MNHSRYRYHRMLLLLVVSVLLCIGAGCRQQDQKDVTLYSATSQSSQTGQEMTQSDLPPAELVFYNYANPMPDQDKVMDEVNKYLKRKINATIRIITLNPTEFEAKIPAILASGQPADLVFTSSWTNNYLANVSRGAFLPLDHLLKQYGVGMQKSIPAILWKGMLVDNQTYAVPLNKEIGHQYGVLMRKDIVDKYHLKIDRIQTWEDLEPLLQIVHQHEPQLRPLDTPEMLYRSIPMNHIAGDWYLPGAINIGESPAFKRDDHQVFNQYATPEFKHFVETMYRWNQAGYLPKDPMYEAEGDWKTGKIFAGALSYAPNYVYERSSQLGYDLDYVNIGQGVIETGDVQSGAFAIPRSSKQPERAMMFLELLYTDPYLANLLKHGIEGVHYIKVDDKHIEPAPGMDPLNPKYDYGYGWMWGNIFISYFDKSYPQDTYEQYEAFNSGNIPAPALGFNMNIAPVSTEVAAINNVLAEYYRPLINGTVDPEKVLPVFLQKLQIAGVETLIAEEQKQLDLWKAAQSSASSIQ